MEINRSNYEIWFVDLLDGNLNLNQVSQLESFLSENPDLKEELSELTLFSINPYEISYQGKKKLRRTPAELSPSQFDYLCVAYIEQDLSAIQQSELLEIVNQDNEKRRSLDLMRKIRLTSSSITFNNKKLLFRRTLMQKVIRFSVIGLSAAAAVTLIITLYLTAPRNLQEFTDNTTQLSIPYNPHENSFSEPLQEKRQNDKSQPVVLQKTNITPSVIKIAGTNIDPDFTLSLTGDSVIRKSTDSEFSVSKVPVSLKIEIKGAALNHNLVAINVLFPASVVNDGRSQIGKFIAKTFRGKFLKEQNPQDTPLKGYEIAAAGVSGINKIFGWQMALDKRNDEAGQLNSVYFSSRLLKIKAPVKKSEPTP